MTEGIGVIIFIVLFFLWLGCASTRATELGAWGKAKHIEEGGCNDPDCYTCKKHRLRKEE